MDPITLSAIITVAGGIWGFFKHRSQRAKKIDAALQHWVPLIFDEVNNRIVQNPKLKVVNKQSLFIDIFVEILHSQGITMTPEIERQALTMADALHFRQHVVGKGTKSRRRPVKVKKEGCATCSH